jgi:hypothetical protein
MRNPLAPHALAKATKSTGDSSQTHFGLPISALFEFHFGEGIVFQQDDHHRRSTLHRRRQISVAKPPLPRTAHHQVWSRSDCGSGAERRRGQSPARNDRIDRKFAGCKRPSCSCQTSSSLRILTKCKLSRSNQQAASNSAHYNKSTILCGSQPKAPLPKAAHQDVTCTLWDPLRRFPHHQSSLVHLRSQSS